MHARLALHITFLPFRNLKNILDLPNKSDASPAVLLNCVSIALGPNVLKPDTMDPLQLATMTRHTNGAFMNRHFNVRGKSLNLVPKPVRVVSYTPRDTWAWDVFRARILAVAKDDLNNGKSF